MTPAPSPVGVTRVPVPTRWRTFVAKPQPAGTRPARRRITAAALAKLAWLLTGGAAFAQEVAAPPPWLDYQIILWQPPPPGGMPALRRLGVSAGMVFGQRDAPLEASAVAQVAAPLRAAGLGFYVENIATDFYAAYHRWTPSHPVTWLFDQARAAFVAGDPAAFWRVPSLSDPAWRARIADRLKDHVRLFGPYHPLFYSLGDETGIADLAAAWDFDLSPIGLDSFRAWLRAQYGSLAALNRQWQTDFTDWPAVLPSTTNAAVAQPGENFSAWGDFKTAMDAAFADAVRTGTAAVHAADPAALAGIEGAQPPGWGGYDYAGLAPAVDVMELYDRGNNIELARACNPSLVVLTTINPADGPGVQHQIWHDLLLGARGLVIWDDQASLLGPDGEPGAPGLALAPTFADLRGSLGAQFIAAEPHRDAVAILYSQASFRLRWLLDRRADGKPWMARGSGGEWDDDNAWRAAMGDAASALVHAGLQPIWLSEAMVAAGALRSGGVRLLILPQAIALAPATAAAIGAFAASGGVVVADAAPGRFDDHGRRLARPSLAAAPLRRVAALSRATLEPLWRAADISPGFRLLRPDGGPVANVTVRSFQDGAVELLGLQQDLLPSDSLAPAQDLDLAFDAPIWVRDLRGPAPARRTSRLALHLDGTVPTLLALAADPLPAPTLSGPTEVASGDAVTLQVALTGPSPARRHAVRLEVFDPHGAAIPAQARTVLVGAAPVAWSLRPASGLPGRWTIRATDRLGAGVAEWSLSVRPRPGG